MNNFTSNSMYYRHGGRNTHEGHSPSNIGGGGPRPQFWQDSFSPYTKPVDTYRQHNYQAQNSWQHQPFTQSWPHSQWKSQSHTTTPFRKDQQHSQKHPFKGAHHLQGPYKYKKNFGNYDKYSEYQEGSSFDAPAKEEDPLPGSEEERKKMLAQETDKVKKCLLTFRNEQATNVGSSSKEKQKEKISVDVSKRSRGKDVEPAGGTTHHHDNKERAKSSFHASSSTPKNIGHKEKVKQSSSHTSAGHKHTSHSISLSENISKNMASNSSHESSKKHNKKFSHSHKNSNNGHGSKQSYSLNSKDNIQFGGSSQIYPSSKLETKSVPFSKNVPQASAQQMKNKGGFNIGSQETISSGPSSVVTKPVAETNISNEDESGKSSFNEDTDENNVQAKIKHLKDRIVRHILGMTSSHLKDFVNKPTSRRFEFAMKHLVKERQELVAREQRGLANSRIHTQSTGSLEGDEVQNFLDTNVTVDLASLPAGIIEHLGDLLQVDLLKCVEEPSTSEENTREGYNDCIIDFENLKAFANTLPNNENIFDFIEEKPNIQELMIKQEVVIPWEGVEETGNGCDLPSNSQSQENQTLQHSHVPCALQENQDSLSVHGNEEALTLQQGTDQNSDQSRFHVLEEQSSTTFTEGIDNWNKSVSTDVTLQSLELTEKLIDKIEQMTSVTAENIDVLVPFKNDLQVETDEPVMEEESTANFGEAKGNETNESTVELTDFTNLESNANIHDTENLCELETNTVTVDEKSSDNQPRLDESNICPAEVVESDLEEHMNVDGINLLDKKDNVSNDVSDVEIIVSRDKDIEIITIADDETVVGPQQKIVDNQIKSQPCEFFSDPDEKMNVDDSQTDKNLNSENRILTTNDMLAENQQISSELKTVESFVQVLEPSSNDFLQSDEPMEETALIHDKNLASAIIPENETGDDTAVTLSTIEPKFSSMSEIAVNLVTVPNLNEELESCAVSGSILFDQSLDENSRNLVENEPEDCKMLKVNEKEWSACSASEVQYGQQGSGNAEFRNLFCELPDLESDPADGEQQCQVGGVPDEIAACEPEERAVTATSVPDTGGRTGSTVNVAAAREKQSSRFPCDQMQDERVSHTAAAEVSTQTDLEEEINHHNVERMLQLLEKSHQLSPQLAKLLRDHFALIKNSQDKHSEPCRMSRESRRDMWNGSKRDTKHKQHSQHGSRINTSNYVGSRTVNETASLIESSAETIRHNEEETQAVISSQEGSEETATDVEKVIFLEMLGIDKEIQRLMDQKLRLYMRLRLNMSGERLNISHFSPRTPPPQERVASQLCGMSTPVSPILGVPTDEGELPQKRQATLDQSVDKNILGSPVVILPHSYEKPSYVDNAENSGSATCTPMLDAMFPRISGVNKRLKLMDTTVVEQVLNSFTIPDSQNKSASSRADYVLNVLENVQQTENYSLVEKEQCSNHSQDTEVMKHSSENNMDIGESRASDCISNSRTDGKPRTRKNKAQSKYISEKVEHILSENLSSSSKAVKCVPDELAAQKSSCHANSSVSLSQHSSKVEKNIMNDSHSGKELPSTSVPENMDEELDVLSSETSVPVIQPTSQSPKEIKGLLLEKTSHSKETVNSSNNDVNEMQKTCLEKGVLLEDIKPLSEDILPSAKLGERDKLSLVKDSTSASKTNKANGKQPLTIAENATAKSAKHKTDVTAELSAGIGRNKGKSNGKECLLLDQKDKKSDESNSSSSNSKRSISSKQKPPPEKPSRKSKTSTTSKNSKLSVEKSPKCKPSSSGKAKEDDSKSNKSVKNEPSNQKYSRRSRTSKTHKEEPISPVKSILNNKTGRQDSDKFVEHESSVSTELHESPRKSSSRSKMATRKSPERNIKEKQCVPPVEIETSRARRKGRRLSKMDENSFLLTEENVPSVNNEDSVPKRAKKNPTIKAQENDVKLNEHPKEEKLSPTRKARQGKQVDTPVQSNVDFPKPNSTPKKQGGRLRKGKGSPVVAALATDVDAESVGQVTKSRSVELVEDSPETNKRLKRKPSKVTEEEPEDYIPATKRTKLKESRPSISDDDPDTPILPSKRSTRARRTSARLESDRHEVISDASDNTQSSGRRSLARSARMTKPYSDFQVDDSDRDITKKKKLRRLSYSENVKNEISVTPDVPDVSDVPVVPVVPIVPVVEEVQQYVDPNESQEKEQKVDDVNCVPDEEESLPVPDWTLKHCSVFLTRILVDNVPVSEENNEDTEGFVNEHSSNPLSEHSSNPVHEHSNNPVSEHSNNPVSEHSNNPVSEHSNNPVSEHSNNPVSEHSNNPVSEHSNNPVSEHSNNPVSEHFSCPVNEQFDNPVIDSTCDWSGSSVNEAVLIPQEQKPSEFDGSRPGTSLSVNEHACEWTGIGAQHSADDVQSACCTPSYTAADSCVDPNLLPSFQVENITIDDNSISTLVSDSVSMLSDGEQKKCRSENTDCDHDSTHSAETMGESTSSQSSRHKTSSRKHKREKKSDTPEHLTFETHTGPILHIKTVGRHVLAACEDGSVYCYSLKSGKFKGKYEGHTGAVTCLYVLEFSPRTGGETPSDIDGEHETPAHVFTGSLDNHLRGFVFRTGEAVFDPQCIGSPIQCMDHSWGYLYLGTKLGDVARFNIEKSCLIGEHLKLSNESILSLIATKEGPRKVLIIGTRSSPIMVRDASNGLLLRSVSSHWGHTAYSLLLENSLVYCGTSTDAIRVFEFTSGKEVCQLKAGCSVVCMTSYNNMLFAGCYDGNIYVFGLQDKKHITTIAGPGKMLLCMDIVKNRVIAGCKEGNKLEAWSFPAELKTIARESKHR